MIAFESNAVMLCENPAICSQPCFASIEWSKRQNNYDLSGG